MKTWRGWDRLVEPVNLWRAWVAYERGKRRRPEVATFALEADRHVHALAAELAGQRYRPGAYRLLRISDPKRRIIAAAPVRDRVVHHAIHRQIAPWWNRSFVDHSYGCLPGRGSHRAILRFREGLRRFRYVMQLDIAAYFYSIDRTILRGLLYRRLPEPSLRGLLASVLESGANLYRSPWVVDWLGWSEPAEPGRGLPIGNLTSQWWGNVYLDAMDHLAMRELKLGGYQRYVDDVAYFGDDRDALIAVRDRLAEWLRVERRLRLKDPSARPRRADRIHDYLGYRVSRRGVELGPKARQRIYARLGRRVGEPARLRAAIGAYCAAWLHK